MLVWIKIIVIIVKKIKNIVINIFLCNFYIVYDMLRIKKFVFCMNKNLVSNDYFII